MRVAGAALALALLGCAGMPEHAVESDDAARPAILGPFAGQGPVRNAEDWRVRRAPALGEAFQREIYGPMPAPSPVTVEAREVIDAGAFGGLGRLEQITLATAAPARRLRLGLALPAGEGPHPALILLSFCGARAEFARDAYAPTFGRLLEFCSRPEEPPATPPAAADEDYLRRAPAEAVLARGYALIVLFAGDVVADNEADAREALALFAAPDGADQSAGAIAAWAWTVSRVIDHLGTDPRFDSGRIAVLGHSRQGKAALVAAAFDARIAAVIAHQSGTGGATLSRHHVGERIADIVGAFPYWFAPRFAAYADNEAALPIDQHQLIGLIAPRAVLLGNGVEDEWADPDGAWRAAEGASPVFDLLGAKGLVQRDRETPEYCADLAYFLRPGRHGISRGDWERFLAFLDAHFRR